MNMQAQSAPAAPEADFLKMAAKRGQAPAGAAGKRKRQLLGPEEGMRQLHSKMDAERMSDEDFDALWRELRAAAQADELRRTQPLDAQALRERTAVRPIDPPDDAPLVRATPENEYWVTGEMDIPDDEPADLDVAPAAQPVDVATAAPAPEPDPAPTFEEAVEHLTRVVTRTNRFREIHRKTLEFCLTRRTLPETEEHIQTYPEYEYAAQNPYRLIRYLIDAGGLDLLELDEEGELVTDERKIGLTEDEIDDLVCSFSLQTTPVGEQVAEDLAPKNRIRDLLNFMPVRFDTYVELMRFCREPRSMAQINQLFAGRDLHFLGTMHSDTTIAIQPSALVDKLERAGALVWKRGWNITAEGRAFLESLPKA